MAIDIEYLSKAYFCFDEPVIYTLKDKSNITINPVSVRQSEIFLTSIDILNIDKNALGSVEIIQMPHLQFIAGLVAEDAVSRQKLVNILILCLGLKAPRLLIEDGKTLLYDDNLKCKITHKDFDEIKRIILYQNIIHYDDEYVNPELKQSMAEVDALKNKNIELPNLERKMAIITAHCGISKKEQMDMTFRSHSLLFEEVCGEVNYTTTRPIALYGGEADKVEWVYKKKKGKFDGYYMDADKYTDSMGGGSIRSTDGATVGNSLNNQFNSFNK